MHTGVFCDVDFDRQGKQVGHASLPYSVDRSPFFQIKLPICQIRNGDGPSLLLMAGVHGDEYEGNFALNRVISTIKTSDIKGRLTILPMANGPAVLAGRRCSPFDSGNLNRSFVDNGNGGPTFRIAHFIEKELMPGHEIVFDLHSGGTSMEFIQCGLCELNPDKKRVQKALDLLDIMALDHSFTADNGTGSPTSMAAAYRAGLVGISAELGGGATVTPDTMRLTMTVLDRLLMGIGITDKPLLSSQGPATKKTKFLHQAGQDHFVFAPKRGWYEPAVRLGEIVEVEQVVGWYHDLETPEVAPLELKSVSGGIVAARRLHAHVEGGDCLFTLFEKK
jgi:predicted deacylase